ncbi:Os09g0447882 [Oryza sativa Japonica Group]|uniref:Os09g0447882 protein n=1 Tax=Oryza sativa subsp. japonica TaxID=39947 RepID=A0A0P0XMF9_ORYSJ|nr:Os09g0447882 [Oryza sativa Japonica Group]
MTSPPATAGEEDKEQHIVYAGITTAAEAALELFEARMDSIQDGPPAHVVVPPVHVVVCQVKNADSGSGPPSNTED